jgi:hypothetical protein
VSLSPLDHDRRYGEPDHVLRACLGQPADNTPYTPGQALTACLRHTWHQRPWALAVAELGMEVDAPAPYSPSGWLALVAEQFAAPRADYGPPAPEM